MDKLNRYQQTARKIASAYGVRVEWAPTNREYIVDYRPYSSAREARKAARDTAAALAAQAK